MLLPQALPRGESEVRSEETKGVSPGDEACGASWSQPTNEKGLLIPEFQHDNPSQETEHGHRVVRLLSHRPSFAHVRCFKIHKMQMNCLLLPSFPLYK